MLAEDLTRRLSPEVLSRRPAVPVRSGYPPVGVYIASSLSLHPSRSCRRSSLTYHLRFLVLCRSRMLFWAVLNGSVPSSVRAAPQQS